jgi:aminoglycoside phosphotransferase family enzyme/predicted kinase
MRRAMSLRDRLAKDPYFSAAGGVEVIETHASWVFLTKHEVYKIKKPVDLGFLDFSTLEKRRAACAAELALNARLAPDVYLNVVPVHEHANGRVTVDPASTLPDSGRVIDWAVRMRRLSDRERADQMLAAGTLSTARVDWLARTIARFHASASSAVAPNLAAALGSPEAIAGNVEQNFAQTRETIERYVRPEEAREIIEFQRMFLERNEQRFRERIRRDRIRDGHGDLRLEHVYFSPAGGGGDEVRILDCIEFNERFRIADIVADLAFLSMDLGFAGRVDLGERLLAKYASETGDYDLYSLVDFYEAYRAFVRAKVATMLADDGDALARERARAQREARRYFMLALSAGRRSALAPSVTAVGGLIGSGKSTVAEALATRLSAPVVCADRTRKQMLGVVPEARVDAGTFSGAYDVHFTNDVYEEVFRRAGCVLASGRPVILDASFRSGELRAKARALAKRFEVPFRFVECRAPLESLRARLRERETVSGVSDARVGLLDDFAAKFEKVTELDAAEHLVVETSGTPSETLATLERSIATWPQRFAG